MHICKYCKKLCKPLGLASHERLCPTNPNRKIEDHPSFGKKGKNQYTKAKVLNLEYIPTQNRVDVFAAQPQYIVRVFNWPRLG